MRRAVYREETTGDVTDSAGNIVNAEPDASGEPDGEWQMTSGGVAVWVPAAADLVPIADAGGYFAATNVEDALQEIGVELGGVGTHWLNGAGPPAGGLGSNGDYYLDTTTEDVYFKAAGVWSIVTNIKGATGATGATGVSGDGFTEVIKSTDESVSSSTVLQNDDELFFAAASGGVYEVHATLIYGSPAGGGTPDFKSAYGEDATTRGAVTCLAFISTGDVVSTIAVAATNQTALFGVGTAVANRALVIRGWHVGNGGTFRLLWAQNTSSANATIVRAGSILRYRKLN